MEGYPLSDTGTGICGLGPGAVSRSSGERGGGGGGPWGHPLQPGPATVDLGLGCRVAEARVRRLGEVTLLSACSSVASTMFWKFDLSAMSHVDKLLDKEGVTLRELMDGEDILQECKAQNRKLLDFLCRRQSMEELVGLVTQDPALDLEERARFKWVPGRAALGGSGQGLRTAGAELLKGAADPER